MQLAGFKTSAHRPLKSWIEPLNSEGSQIKVMNYPIRTMLLDDYDTVYRLWSAAEGISLGEEDSREGIGLCLRRNPKCCFIALDGTEIVGAVLSRVI